MNDFITITYSDLQRIVLFAQKEARDGRYIRQLYLIQPKLATQGTDSSIALESSPLRSASEGDLIPVVIVL